MQLLLQVALVTEPDSQNVTSSIQSLSDFKIVRPAKNKQG